MNRRRQQSRAEVARKLGFRSGLEEKIAEQLRALRFPFEYETHTLTYRVEETRKYTPDFLLPSGIIVETKGRWTTADRKKMKLVKAQHPDLDIRLVFSNSRARISKQSRTTYGSYCETLGFPYADKTIPVAWLRERHNERSLAALRRLKEGA